MKSYSFSECFNQYHGIIYDYERKIKLTSDQFMETATLFKDEIEKISGRKSMFVLISMCNSLNFMACFFGVLNADAVPIIASKKLSDAELELYKKKCNPNLIISDYDLGLVERTFSILNNTIYCSVVHKDDTAVQQLKNRYGVFILHPTSGTTGESRLCLRDERGCLAEPLNHIDTINGDEIHSMLCMLPLNHAYGFGSAFLLGMLQSYDMYLISEFNPRKIIRILTEEKIDYMPANPAVLDLLLRTHSKVPFQVPRYILSAGSVFKSQLVSEFYEKFGVYIKASYGSTETGEICLQREEKVCPEGCVGHTLKQTRIEIRDLNGVNVLYVNNPSLMNGYLQEDYTVDASLIDAKGYFPTKDIAEMEQNGMVTLHGRLDDVINRFGVKIIPEEIEHVISSFSHVKDVHVYGKTDEKGYEEINAVVDTDSSMNEILDLCRRNLTRQMVPKNIYLQPIPKSETGKIIRKLLP